MLEYLTALTMLILVFGHALLIKKCTKLTDELEPSAQNLSTELKDITSILDDIADLLNEALQSFAGGGATQTPSSPMEAILNGFISSMTSKTNHATPQEQEEWEVLPPDSTPTLETENQLD